MAIMLVYVFAVSTERRETEHGAGKALWSWKNSFSQCLLDKNISGTITHQNDYWYQTAQGDMKSECNKLPHKTPTGTLPTFNIILQRMLSPSPWKFSACIAKGFSKINLLTPSPNKMENENKKALKRRLMLINRNIQGKGKKKQKLSHLTWSRSSNERRNFS